MVNEVKFNPISMTYAKPLSTETKLNSEPKVAAIEETVEVSVHAQLLNNMSKDNEIDKSQLNVLKASLKNGYVIDYDKLVNNLQKGEFFD